MNGQEADHEKIGLVFWDQLSGCASNPTGKRSSARKNDEMREEKGGTRMT